MITFEFEYYRPESVAEAVGTFLDLTAQDKDPLYYAGGTEILSFARANQLRTGAVVDLKAIPECNVLGACDGELVVGATVTQTQVTEANLFPLLTATTRRAADHTSRNRITVGGNICGRIPYREGVLPFLLADSQVVVAGSGGLRRLPLTEVFDQKLHLEPGEFLVQILTDQSYVESRGLSLKKTRLEAVDYPLVTVAALARDGRLRAAFSGVCAFPFRSARIEDDLGRADLPTSARIDLAVSHLPAPIVADLLGSAEYREHVLRNTLTDILAGLEA